MRALRWLPKLVETNPAPARNLHHQERLRYTPTQPAGVAQTRRWQSKDGAVWQSKDGAVSESSTPPEVLPNFDERIAERIASGPGADHLRLLVGLAGLEPATFGPPDQRANQAAPQPVHGLGRVGSVDGRVREAAGRQSDSCGSRYHEASTSSGPTRPTGRVAVTVPSGPRASCQPPS